MARTETVILTNMCLIYDHNGNILVENRIDRHWGGIALPGGHVEPGESFVESVIREMREETGLTVERPKLCGLVQFRHFEGWRYMVALFKTDRFHGELRSSEEGEVFWIPRGELAQYHTVPELPDLLALCDSDEFSEIFYDGDSNVNRRVL